MTIETGAILMLLGVGWFFTFVVYRWNKFAGNMGLLLTGIGTFFYFVQIEETLFGFGGLLIAFFSLIRMIWDLFK